MIGIEGQMRHNAQIEHPGKLVSSDQKGMATDLAAGYIIFDKALLGGLALRTAVAAGYLFKGLSAPFSELLSTYLNGTTQCAYDKGLCKRCVSWVSWQMERPKDLHCHVLNLWSLVLGHCTRLAR